MKELIIKDVSCIHLDEANCLILTCEDQNETKHEIVIDPNCSMMIQNDGSILITTQSN